MTEPFSIVIGGVTLVAADIEDLKVGQDSWITAKLERADLADPALIALESPARAREVRLRILESGEIGAILAGFLVVEGERWNVKSARANHKLLDSVSDAIERELLQAMVEGLVQGFFALGRSSDAVIGKLSPANQDPSHESSAVSEPDIGSPSSEPSPDTSPIASEMSFAGLSATP